MQGSFGNNACPRCSQENTRYTNYCANCGLAIDGTCPSCGTKNPNSTHYCTTCGHNFATPAEPARSASPATPGERPGGFWVRAVAFIIDGIVISSAQTAIFAVFAGSLFSETAFTDLPVGQVDFPVASFILSFGMIAILSFLYEPILVALWSTTVGKRAFSLYVLRPNGSRVSFGRMLGRQLAEGITAMPFNLTYWVVAFRPDKRGLHDLIADTIVVQRD